MYVRESVEEKKLFLPLQRCMDQGDTRCQVGVCQDQEEKRPGGEEEM